MIKKLLFRDKLYTTLMVKRSYWYFFFSLILYVLSVSVTCWFASGSIQEIFGIRMNKQVIAYGINLSVIALLFIAVRSCFSRFSEIFKETGEDAYENYMCFFSSEREHIRQKINLADEFPEEFIKSVKKNNTSDSKVQRTFASFITKQKKSFKENQPVLFYLKVHETLLIFILNFSSIIFSFASLYMVTCMASCGFSHVRPDSASFTYWFTDGLYFSMTTISSLGYAGDFSVVSSWAKLIVITEILFFLVILSMVFPLVLNFLDEKTSYNAEELIQIFEQKLKDKADELNFYAET